MTGGAVILTAASAGVGQDELVTLLALKAPASQVVDVHQEAAHGIGPAQLVQSHTKHLRARPGIIHDLHPLYDLMAEGHTIVAVRPALFDTFAAWLSECGGPEIDALGLDLRAGVVTAPGRGHDNNARRQAKRLEAGVQMTRPTFIIRNDVHGVEARHHFASAPFDLARQPDNGNLAIPFPGRSVLQRVNEEQVGLCEGAALGEKALRTWPPQTVDTLLRWGRTVETALTPMIPTPWRAWASGGNRVVKAPSRDLRQRARARRRAQKLHKLQALVCDPDVPQAGWEAMTAWSRHRARRARRRLAVSLLTRLHRP